MVDPNLISLGLLGLSVLQTISLAWIAARYQTVAVAAANARSVTAADRVERTAAREADSRDVAVDAASARERKP